MTETTTEAKPDLLMMVRAYAADRETVDDIENGLKSAKARAKESERRLADYMEAAGTEHVRVEGKTYYLFSQEHFSLTEANTSAIREALLQDAGSDADFVQETLNRKRVGEFYRDRFKTGQSVPEALHLFVERRVGVRA